MVYRARVSYARIELKAETSQNGIWRIYHLRLQQCITATTIILLHQHLPCTHLHYARAIRTHPNMSHTSPEESVEEWLIETLHIDNYEQLMDGISILSSPKFVSESTNSGRRVIRFPIWAGYLDLQKRVSHYRNTTYRSLPEACEMTLRYMTGRLREG